MENEKIKFGILGGTFNPIHLGHLNVAKLVQEKLNLNKIIFLINGNPPHKSKLIPIENRYQMLKLAIANNKNFLISDLETEKRKIFYTIDSLKKLKIIYPKIKFYFISGNDCILTIDKWKDYQQLLNECQFVIILKNKDNLIETTQKILDLNKNVIQSTENQILLLENIIITSNISSTLIRNKIKEKESIKNLVPKTVKEYIYTHKLYLN